MTFYCIIRKGKIMQTYKHRDTNLHSYAFFKDKAMPTHKLKILMANFYQHFTESENPRVAEAVRDLWRPPGATPG